MAVYTALSHTEISDFLYAYDLPGLESADGILSGVENTNYLVTLVDGSKFILTLFEKRVLESDLPFFAGLMEHVAQRGVPVPRPLRARDGQAIRQLKGKSVLITSFLMGKGVSAIHTHHVSELGDALGRLHLAGSDYGNIRENTLSVQGWKLLAAKVIEHADTITPGLGEELRLEMVDIEALWPRDLPRGIIHADLFPDNVFFDSGNRLTGLIDFYFSCDDFLAYDIAICINAWCFEKDMQFNITKARFLLNSYNAVRQLSAAELTALPVLARGAALRFLLTRAHDWIFRSEGALVRPKDPMEYLQKLRFHRSVQHHKEYGL